MNSRSLLVTVVTAAGLFAANAHAQSAPDRTPAADQPTVELPVFTVSTEKDTGYRSTNAMGATKTNTPIKETPQSIQVINQEFIADQGAFLLADAMRFTSGVVEGTDTRGDRFNLRGYQTGIPFKDSFRDTGRSPREMANIERLEVVKGPAALTLGRTNPGGAINMVTKRPLMNAQASVSASVGSYQFYRATVDATGPLGSGKKFAYRLVGAWQDSESFRDTMFIEREFISPSFLWQIAPMTSLRLTGDYLHDNRTPNRGLVVLNGKIADVPLSTYFGRREDRVETTQYNSMVEFLHRFHSNLSLRVASRYVNTEEFSYITNLNSVNATAQTIARTWVRTSPNIIDNNYTQAELLYKASFGGMEHNFLVGAEVGWNDADDNTFNATLAPVSIFNPTFSAVPGAFPVIPTASTLTGTEFDSYYVQDQIYLFSRKLNVLIGGRYDGFSQTATNKRVTPAATESLTGHYVDPRLGFAWMPSAGWTFYGLYTTSNVPPTQANPDGQVLQPSRGVQYEVGTKASLFGGRLAATLGIYHLDQENIANPDPTRPGYSINIGARRAKGAELDLTYVPSESWTILASAAYNNGEVSKDLTIPKGNKLPRSPEKTASFWTRYDFKQGSLRRLALGLGLIYSDRSYGDPQNTFIVPSYTRWDALVQYRWSRVRLNINLRNIFDREYIQSASSATDVFPGIPFTVQSTISVRF